MPLGGELASNRGIGHKLIVFGELPKTTHGSRTTETGDLAPSVVCLPVASMAAQLLSPKDRYAAVAAGRDSSPDDHSRPTGDIRLLKFVAEKQPFAAALRKQSEAQRSEH